MNLDHIDLETIIDLTTCHPNLPDPEDYLDFKRFILGLPAQERACAVACFVEGCTETEAAEKIGISRSTVRVYLQRATLKLKTIMDPKTAARFIAGQF